MLLNKHNLQIAELASKGDSRYTLHAINVTPKWTATTNGHYLVTVTLPKAKDAQFPAIEGFTPTNGTTPSFLLDRDAALDIAKAIPKKTTIPILSNAAVGADAENISLAVTDLDNPKVFRPRKVDGQFPNIDIVIPDSKETKLTIGLSADYLAKLCKSAISTCGKDVKIRLELRTADVAVKMTAYAPETDQEWMAVLMPVRL